MDLGILKVQETAEKEIEASRVYVNVRVVSQKTVFGKAAFEAAAELRALVEDLKKVNETIDFDTQSVLTQSESGLIAKNSAAVYTLRIKVEDVENLGAVLGVCAEGKNTTVHSLNWGYDEEEVKLELVKAAMRKANRKAEELASVTDYRIAGIRSISDTFETPRPHDSVFDTEHESARMLRRRQEGPVDIGTEFISKKRVSARCNVEYFIDKRD